MTLIERVTDHYLAIHIPGKTSEAVMNAMEQLQREYGRQFSTIFKTITTDNGPEFEDFANVQQWGTEVFFAHPYSSWERAVNEGITASCAGIFQKAFPWSFILPSR